MITVTVVGDTGVAKGPFPLEFLRVAAALSGRKIWAGSQTMKFDASPANVRLLRDSDFKIDWVDETGDLAIVEAMENMPTQHEPAPELITAYAPAHPLWGFQRDALALGCWRIAYAYLFDMGLGKTAITIANAGILFMAEKITGVLVLAPRGVHKQWLIEQIPKHNDPRIPVNLQLWRKKLIPDARLKVPGHLNWLAMNIDAIRTAKGRELIVRFLELHKGKSLWVFDESHNIKTPGADRTEASLNMSRLATYRRILTGTPISRNIIDAWAQFYFLDPRILGHRYLTSFKARYCIMRYDANDRSERVVGQRHTEEFYRLIAPHAYRITKKEARRDLPDKVYDERPYVMGPETRHHYQNLKQTYMTALESGEIVNVTNAATALLRLQQVICGYLPQEDMTLEVISSERIQQLLEIVKQLTGQVIIWARFNEDIRRLNLVLNDFEKGSVVTYTGATSERARDKAKERFLVKRDARFFVSNPAAGGTGLNLQGECLDVIYYSNSFNALHRWQSEDRSHREGMRGAVIYHDLIAEGSVDRYILRNLRQKKNISDLTLDEIRQAILATDNED